MFERTKNENMIQRWYRIASDQRIVKNDIG
jgi:hypothetical protein